MTSRVSLIVIFSLFLAANACAGGEAEDIAAGRKIAENLCSTCHAIGNTGSSPHPDAPPFRSIAAKGNVERLEEALGEGIVVGHPDMPEFKFQPRKVSALIAYLKSLSGRS